MEEDPAAVGLRDRNLVRSLEAAGQADLLAAVERRAMNLDLPVAVLVAVGGVLPDDVGVVELVGCLPQQEGCRVDDELARAVGARPDRNGDERKDERKRDTCARSLSSCRQHDVPSPPMCRETVSQCDEASALDLQRFGGQAYRGRGARS